MLKIISRLSLAFLFLSIFSITQWGCRLINGDNNEEVPVPPLSTDPNIVEIVTATIGPVGGRIQSVDNDLEIYFPPGALAASTTISIAKNLVNKALGGQFPIFRLSPDSLALKTPASLLWKYDSSLIKTSSEEQYIKLAYENNNAWVILPNSTVDLENHTVSTSIIHFTDFTIVNPAPLNTPLGDHKNVVAYSNWHENASDPNNLYSAGVLNYDYTWGAQYLTGEKWQCVEYVVRYYWVVYHQDINVEGQRNCGIDFWCTELNRNTWEKRSLQQFKNDGPTPPLEGDILVFSSGVNDKFGHVAIVKSVNGEDVRIIQQNYYCNSNDADCELTYKDGHLSGFWNKNDLSIRSSYQVLGWLRQKNMVVPETPILSLKNVPSGMFQRDDNPANTTTISAFRMSQYEITQDQFTTVTGLTNPSYFPTVVNGPVEQVNWYHALVFCNKLSIREGLTPAYSIDGSTDPTNWGTVPAPGNLGAVSTIINAKWDAATCNWDANGYRLPTEAEWQWAAMGATDSRDKSFAGSNGSNLIDDFAWYHTNSGNTIHPVGSKSANELGICDLSGNAWEWCWDWKGDYPAGALTNPKGGSSGTYRVIRGGAYHNDATWVTVDNRGAGFPWDRNVDSGFGFRVVRP